MTRLDDVRRSAVILGAVSVFSAVFVFVRGDFEFVQIGGAGVIVALRLGLLVGLAGWLGKRMLILIAGAGFLLAAGVVLAFWSRGHGGFLDSNASTFALWLGLGAGLVALGASGGDAAAPEREP